MLDCDSMQAGLAEYVLLDVLRCSRPNHLEKL